jgi:FkbM family methyltransferase
MIRRVAKRAIRGILEAAGYRVYHHSVLPYGIDFILDIKRLSRAWNVPIRTFFDVGAHEGQTSASVLSSFADARVFAFEPHPVTFSKLLQRSAENSRLAPHNLAISNANGPARFFEYSSSTLNSLIPDAQYPVRKGVAARAITVQCTTLDKFCNQNGIQTIDVLKIDTEGCELVVLQGAEQLFSAGRVRFVYAEFNDMSPRLGATGGALIPISDFLAPFGFRFVATYPDYMEITNETEMHVGANALFVLPPPVAKQSAVSRVLVSSGSDSHC